MSYRAFDWTCSRVMLQSFGCQRCGCGCLSRVGLLVLVYLTAMRVARWSGVNGPWHGLHGTAMEYGIGSIRGGD